MKVIREWKIVCPSCQGRGYIPTPELIATSAASIICPACEGTQTVVVTERIEDDITGADVLADLRAEDEVPL